jgi:hypothetical protein
VSADHEDHDAYNIGELGAAGAHAQNAPDWSVESRVLRDGVAEWRHVRWDFNALWVCPRLACAHAGRIERFAGSRERASFSAGPS